MDQAKNNNVVAKVLAAVIIAAGMLAFCSDNVTKKDGVRDTDALWVCQNALKSVSRDPEKADIPYVGDMGKDGEFYFAWGPSTKMVRMRNGLGLEVAASASCTVDAKSKRITSLTLDGKSVL